MQGSFSSFEKHFADVDLGSDGLSQIFRQNSIESVQKPNTIKTVRFDDVPQQQRSSTIRQIQREIIDNQPVSLYHQALSGQGKKSQLLVENMVGGAGNKYQKVNGKDSIHLQMQKKSPIKYQQPMQSRWTLGDLLRNSNNAHLRGVAVLISGNNCHICQGFGHSKTKCFSNQQFKKIFKYQQLMKKIQTFADQWYLSNSQYMLNQKTWLYCEIYLAFLYKALKSDENDSQEMKETIYGIVRQLLYLQKQRCIFCDGYGHFATQKVMVRVKKTDDQRLKRKYTTGDDRVSVDVVCGTKLAIERAIEGYSESTRLFAGIAKDLKNSLRTVKTTTQSISANATLEDFIDQFESAQVVDELDQVDQPQLDVKQLYSVLKKASYSVSTIDKKRKRQMEKMIEKSTTLETTLNYLDDQDTLSEPATGEAVNDVFQEITEEEEKAWGDIYELDLRTEELTNDYLQFTYKFAVQTEFAVELFPEFTFMVEEVVLTEAVNTVWSVMRVLFKNFIGVTIKHLSEKVLDKGFANIIEFITALYYPTELVAIIFDKETTFKTWWSTAHHLVGKSIEWRDVVAKKGFSLAQYYSENTDEINSIIVLPPKRYMLSYFGGDDLQPLEDYDDAIPRFLVKNFGKRPQKFRKLSKLTQASLATKIQAYDTKVSALSIAAARLAQEKENEAAKLNEGDKSG